MAMTLADLHASGFSHNDIKPDNFVFGQDGNVNLIDYDFMTVCLNPLPSKRTSQGPKGFD